MGQEENREFERGRRAAAEELLAQTRNGEHETKAYCLTIINDAGRKLGDVTDDEWPSRSTT